MGLIPNLSVFAHQLHIPFGIEQLVEKKDAEVVAPASKFVTKQIYNRTSNDVIIC